ncbi:hypothetical protein ACFQ68_44865, partial [Amycolatopsis japonica]|uniref:hypothetical protein n=1 Tax=Amycolatopsis japonica TaxID=208439 RepID=UPI00366D5923
RAGEFAAALGVDVSFAVDQVLFGNPGDYEARLPAARVGKLALAADGTPLVDDLRDGGAGWVKKKPGGQEEEGTYTLIAPAAAPRLGLTEPVALGPKTPVAPTRETLVGWWPSADGTGPQTLRDHLREHLLLRWFVPELSEEEDKLRLAGTPWGRLSPDLKDIVWKGMVWKGMAKAQTIDDAARSLGGVRFGQFSPEFQDKVWKLEEARTNWDTFSLLRGMGMLGLPWELQDMILDLVSPDIEELVWDWLKDAMNKKNNYGQYLYSAAELAWRSGGFIDDWVVEQLRGVARANWQAQLGRGNRLADFDKSVVVSMLQGFVDAALPARSEALPSVRGVVYVARRDPSSGAAPDAVAWVDYLRSVTDPAIWDRLNEYPPMMASLQGLLARVDIRARALLPGDRRIGTVHFSVRNQRLPGGWTTPVVHQNALSRDWLLLPMLADAVDVLQGAGVTTDDEVFTQARDLLDKYSPEFSEATDLTRRLQDLYNGRREDAVVILAETIHSVGAGEFAELRAAWLAEVVGIRRQYGVLGHEWGPVFERGLLEVADLVERSSSGQGSDVDARQGSVLEPGWLVPVGDGHSVGVVEAGMVLGDLGSDVASAGSWLPHE